jgi:DNA repair protein RecO (recombination protein O)
LINKWVEENRKQAQLYHLLRHVLGQLDSGAATAAELSILFQMRLLNLSGHSPNLRQCAHCQKQLESIQPNRVVFDISKGGILCDTCSAGAGGRIRLSKGTIKQFNWIKSGDLEKACRMRFGSQALEEGLEFLEAFIPYVMGIQPRSLKFLKQIRK